MDAPTYEQKSDALAIRNLTSRGGIVMNPETGEGLFTIKRGETRDEARITTEIITQKMLSLEEIAHTLGIGIGKGKQKKWESGDEAGFREIHEELGPQKRHLKKIGHVGDFVKFRDFYIKYISIDLFVLLNTKRKFEPSDEKHLVYETTLERAIQLMKSPEEKKFLQENIDPIMRKVEEFKKNKRHNFSPAKLVAKIF